jgi:hypothetical protein
MVRGTATIAVSVDVDTDADGDVVAVVIDENASLPPPLVPPIAPHKRSTTAYAMATPSIGDVPLPISSKRSNERGVACS